MKLVLWLSGVVGLCACQAANTEPTPQEDPIEYEGSRTDMYEARYCEVLCIALEGTLANVDVYNSLPFGDCPQEQWEALEPEVIQAELGCTIAKLNGPRYFLMDEGAAITTTDETVQTFGEIKMKKLATVELDISNGLPSEKYQERSVTRTTQFTWNAGRRIFELISSDNKSYVMQSYSVQLAPELTIADLETVDSRFTTLPDGWTFRTRVLEETLYVRDVDGIAKVIQDDLENTYQFNPNGP